MIKFQTVAYKEVVVEYNDNNMRIVNNIWEEAPFKFRQYTDVRQGNLVEVYVMPTSVWDEHIHAIVNQITQALLEDAE